jgi:putative peptidyl-prolyl cis-trans isomerase
MYFIKNIRSVLVCTSLLVFLYIFLWNPAYSQERGEDKSKNTKASKSEVSPKKVDDPQKDSKPRLKGEIINEVIAIVGPEPVTIVDMEQAAERYRNTKLLKKGKRSLKSQILDILIAHAIVSTVAEEESIKVPPARIQSEIKKRMDHLGIKDEKVFKRRLERELKLPYTLWKQELSYEIKKEQIIQIRIQPERPTDLEVQNWYKINKAKVGREVRNREIIFRPASKALKDEIKIEKELNEIRQKAIRNKNFASIAKTDSRNVSKYKTKGGLTDWRNIAEIAKDNILYANHAFQLHRVGQISPVFKMRNGYYCILKSEGSRFVPLDKVYNLVQNLLYREKQEAAFYDWIEQQRKLIGVKINMPDYQSQQ